MTSEVTIDNKHRKVSIQTYKRLEAIIKDFKPELKPSFKSFEEFIQFFNPFLSSYLYVWLYDYIGYWNFQRIVRGQEFRADFIAAHVTSEETVARALAKINVLADVFEKRVVEYYDYDRKNELIVRIMNKYIKAGELVSIRKVIIEDALTPLNPLSSHPSLFERIQALGISFDDDCIQNLTLRKSVNSLEYLEGIPYLKEKLLEDFVILAADLSKRENGRKIFSESD